jgi:hypothetical protein
MASLFKIVWELLWIVLSIMAGVAWLTFCFGSVIAVVLFLIFAPPLLLAPFGPSRYGLACLA